MKQLNKIMVGLLVLVIDTAIHIGILNFVVDVYMVTHNYFEAHPRQEFYESSLFKGVFVIGVAFYFLFHYLMSKYILSKIAKQGEAHLLGITLNICSIFVIIFIGAFC